MNLRQRRHPASLSASHRIKRPEAIVPNGCWSVDFVCDCLFDVPRFRALKAIDSFSRECLAIEAGQSILGQDVVEVMTQLALDRGVPQRIQCDNGSKLICKELDKWAYEQDVVMDFSRPGKPSDNAVV